MSSVIRPVYSCTPHVPTTPMKNTPLRFRFLAHFTLLLDLFFNVKILVGDIERAPKYAPGKKIKNYNCVVFLGGALFGAPPLDGAPGGRLYRRRKGRHCYQSSSHFAFGFGSMDALLLKEGTDVSEIDKTVKNKWRWA